MASLEATGPDLCEETKDIETKTNGRAFGLLFVTFFCWGSLYVGGKLIAQDLPPALVACLRCNVALVPLLGISLTGASMASLISALTPVSVTILAALMLKEHMGSNVSLMSVTSN